MGVMLVEEAEEVIEAVPTRQTRLRLAHIAEAPLADERRFVTSPLKHLRHDHVVRPQRLGERISLAGIAADPGVAMMLTSHEHTAGRGTDCRPRVELGKAYPFARHLINARGLNEFLAVATDLSVTEIVSENEDDVGFGG